MLLCRYGHQAKIVHFLGRNKPWNAPYKQQSSTEIAPRDSKGNLEQYVNLWWAEYYDHTEMNVNEPREFQDSEPTEHLNVLEVAPPWVDHAATSSDVRLQSCINVNHLEMFLSGSNA